MPLVTGGSIPSTHSSSGDEQGSNTPPISTLAAQSGITKDRVSPSPHPDLDTEYTYHSHTVSQRCKLPSAAVAYSDTSSPRSGKHAFVHLRVIPGAPAPFDRSTILVVNRRETPSPSMAVLAAIAGVDRLSPPETTETQSNPTRHRFWDPQLDKAEKYQHSDGTRSANISRLFLLFNDKHQAHQWQPWQRLLVLTDCFRRKHQNPSRLGRNPTRHRCWDPQLDKAEKYKHLNGTRSANISRPFSSLNRRETPSPSMAALAAIAGVDRLFPLETPEPQSTGSESHLDL
ncbi:hypothetical protein K440DRAFT_660620 [Wilcoxina mikolae CBS 423.85]|nr:hypothetical protein K440DRAFT_660620 [Wilcoxina mikolae CBS 423.85]